MPVVPGLTVSVPSGRAYYRITAISFRTATVGHHRRVVTGEGAVRSRNGARYNHPGARAVYLAEEVPSCLAERMVYFHREVLGGVDSSHITGMFPSFEQRFILWEVELQNAVPDVFELSVANAPALNVFPALMLNPSQDYHHLKDRRAAIQHNGYRGLRAPSTRARGVGHMVVVFEDQFRNVGVITPFEVDFRLIAAGLASVPYTNHAVDVMDFEAGEVRVLPPAAGVLPPVLQPYQNWTRVEFNH